MKSPKVLNPDFKLICDDAKNALMKIKDNSVHAIITDPPYGYGMQDVDIKEMTQYILDGGTGKLPEKIRTGINGNGWDSLVPMPDVWNECYRAVEYGGYLVAFGTPATIKYLDIAIGMAGFKIKTYAVWAYSTGCPRGKTQRQFLKELGASKSILKLYGHLKPSLCPTIELMVIAQKPLKEKSIAQNLINHGVGAINAKYARGDKFSTNLITDGSQIIQATLGTSLKASTICKFDAHDFAPISLLIGSPKPQQKEKLFLLDDFKTSFKHDNKTMGNKSGMIKENPVDEYNFHPTVKPLSLMGYLIRLFSVEGQTVLDPFMGSCTTGVASLINNRNFIGIEAEKKYFELCEHRMNEIEKVVNSHSSLHMDFISKIRGDETTLEIFNSLSEKLKNGSIKSDELIYLREIRAQANKIKSFKKAA